MKELNINIVKYKTKTVASRVTEEQYEILQEFARKHKTTGSRVLQALINDVLRPQLKKAKS